MYYFCIFSLSFLFNNTLEDGEAALCPGIAGLAMGFSFSSRRLVIQGRVFMKWSFSEYGFGGVGESTVAAQLLSERYYLS